MQSKLFPILVFLFCHQSLVFGRPMADSRAFSQGVDASHASLPETIGANSARNPFEENGEHLLTETKGARRRPKSSESIPTEETPLLDRPQNEESSSKPSGPTPEQSEQAKGRKTASILVRFKQCLARWYRGHSAVATIMRALVAYLNPAKIKNKEKDAKEAKDVAKAKKSASTAKEDVKLAAKMSDEKPPTATKPENPSVQTSSTETAKPIDSSETSKHDHGAAGK
ncbi:hypothetical protein PGT21_035464 [Puccinia graminis f. sp. tritici]|uniref:Uncharacterized protein n=1 Tax=Puccinia graminis f. sp. tritici TaxID=56615 RepID=A0A5B0MG37_PUCGR|nr:hypothetical protein PGTUg99_036779 [Puccinia graminis f. sp. tritici]KAA1091546.1 hypothetical protein PGT21_035464 [Puccinia graminis f. sp. tritici]